MFPRGYDPKCCRTYAKVAQLVKLSELVKRLYIAASWWCITAYVVVRVYFTKYLSFVNELVIRYKQHIRISNFLFI